MQIMVHLKPAVATDCIFGPSTYETPSPLPQLPLPPLPALCSNLVPQLLKSQLAAVAHALHQPARPDSAHFLRPPAYAPPPHISEGEVLKAPEPQPLPHLGEAAEPSMGIASVSDSASVSLDLHGAQVATVLQEQPQPPSFAQASAAVAPPSLMQSKAELSTQPAAPTTQLNAEAEPSTQPAVTATLPEVSTAPLPPPPQQPQPQQTKFVPRERSVPSTPLARVAGFVGLGASLLYGTVRESVGRAWGGAPAGSAGSSGGEAGDAHPASAFLSEGNAERLANALCRMRGAALKLGQMLSIQDDNLL
jgi:hypothetical protein